MTDNRLPTALWVDAVLANIRASGGFYYIPHTGDHSTGLIMLKLNGLSQGCKVLTQQRSLDGDLLWVNALEHEIVSEKDADAYIARSVNRDPDIWVIEIEDTNMCNPFDI